MYDDGKGVLSLILSLVGLNVSDKKRMKCLRYVCKPHAFRLQITTSFEQLKDFLSGTLLSVQEEHVCVKKPLWDVALECVEELKERGLVTVKQDSQDVTLRVTRLGKATFKGDA